MALHANTVLEVQTTGADTNGGGFRSDSVGTDKSYGASQAATTWTDLEIHASTNTKIKSTGGSPRAFGDTDRGNLIQIVAGGAWTGGLYQIAETAMDGSGYMTLDRSPAAAGSTGATGTLGGAFASPGKAANVAAVSGQIIYVKSGTYTLTTATPGAAGPVVLAAARLKIIGYNSARDDGGTSPIISAGAITTVDIVTGAATVTLPQMIINIEVDGNSLTAVNGFNLAAAYTHAIQCTARNCNQATTNYGFSNGRTIGCAAYSCGDGFTAGTPSDCLASASTRYGFSAGVITGCLAKGCASHGFNLTANGSRIFGCTSDGNTGSGFFSTGSIDGNFLASCVATNNSAYGYNIGSTANRHVLIKCASYNNTSGALSPLNVEYLPITLTADPYVNRAGGDFRPNGVAGGGILIRNAAIAIPTQTQAEDVGAVQHTDPARANYRIGI